MDLTFWQKQTNQTPLFPDIEWSKPQRRQVAGKLAVVGGNRSGFAAVAEAYQTALGTGAGECRMILPDVLKSGIKNILPSGSAVFLESTPSGGLSKRASKDLLAVTDWADAVLLIGDNGRNSETAMLFEDLLGHTDKPLIITRDSFDLLSASLAEAANRPGCVMVLAFAQLQKLFKELYYPRPLTFSISAASLAEALHKFTITYPLSLTVLHREQLLTASGGRVTSTPWSQPLDIWRGKVAAKASVYVMWHPGKTLEALTASLLTI